MKKLVQNKLCIYHGNCADGFGAAWVVRKAFGSDVEFYPGVYQNPPPDVTGREVIMVDFSYKRAVIEEMAAKAESILIIDHHKTAIEDLLDLSLKNLVKVFNLDKSGAGLTWDFFFDSRDRPILIDLIEDRDLWRFRFAETRAVQAAVFSHPYDFEIWDKLMSNDAVKQLEIEGTAIERKHHKDIAELVGVTRRLMWIAGYQVPVANLPYTMTSDAGHLMAEGYPFAACYWDTPDGRVFSLRSRDDGLDVSEIAKKFGGGGHAHAAGFRVPLGTEPIGENH